MMYALLVSDIDGTLVAENKIVPLGVRAAVKAAQARGIRVCLATGRMWEAARQFVDEVEADPPVILYNGGFVYDFKTGHTLWTHPLPRQRVMQILPVLRRFPQVSRILFIHGKAYAERRTHFVDLFARRDSLVIDAAPEISGVPEFEALLEDDPMKILIIGDPADLAVLSAALAALPGPPINQVFSQRDYLEILSGDVSKGVALPVLARAAGVPLERVVAVGDALNDLTMLQTAGLGIAVEGSPPELLAVAGWVCPPPEREGVRVVIERVFLSGAMITSEREAPREPETPTHKNHE